MKRGLRGGVVPTLNAFDNGDIRATVAILVRMRAGKPGGGKGALLSEDRSLTIATSNDQTLFVFYGNRVNDIRIQDDKINTLQARMGTGGNNMPLVAQVIGIQNTVIGRSDTAGPQGKGHTEEGEPMFTVDTTSPHAVADNSIVRRLTPLECERLQGFPDGWTEGQPDTHRYKQMGNAVAVPVVEWIVQGICDTFDIAG
jgi:DNA (cytosine-5)-methyltransferase 1